MPAGLPIVPETCHLIYLQMICSFFSLNRDKLDVIIGLGLVEFQRPVMDSSGLLLMKSHVSQGSRHRSRSILEGNINVKMDKGHSSFIFALLPLLKKYSIVHLSL